jgi:hypothetical protein
VICTSSQPIAPGSSKSFSIRARYIGTSCFIAASDPKPRTVDVQLTISGGGAPTIVTSKPVVVASCV